ncbi:MAG: FAD:protein FMN transferase, partial [Myxococcales bacterium]
SLGAAFAEFHRLEGLMSTWIASSEVWAINDHGFERPVAVGPETFAVLERSRWASELSGGVFDITFEAMKGLWRFDHDLDGRVPDARDVAARRVFVDHRDVRLDAARREVRLRRPETRINLGGIAKGYAVDRAAQRLLAGGLTSFIVQAGGDLYVHGRKPDGSPWIVGVRDPRGPESSFFGSLAVEDHAFSSAGDYERSFLRDGRRYHHILDPRTGYPATASRGVTVWAPDAFTADAIDDAVFILGPDRGLALCEQLPSCGAVIVDADNKVWVSSRLTSLFHQHRPPTGGT